VVFDQETANVNIGPINIETLPPTPVMWYRDSWPLKQQYIQNARKERQEIYNATYRKWTWRLDYEQLIYSHLDKDAVTGKPRYLLDLANMRILAGEMDEYDFSDFDSATEHIASLMVNTPGIMNSLVDTGHSIHNERPGFLAQTILAWIKQNA
jgi:hypothetical protein